MSLSVLWSLDHYCKYSLLSWEKPLSDCMYVNEMRCPTTSDSFLIGQEPLSGAVECPSGSYGKFKCVHAYSSHTLFLLLSVLGQVSTYTHVNDIPQFNWLHWPHYPLHHLGIVIIILCSWPISKESKVVGCLISFMYMQSESGFSHDRRECLR